MSIPSESRRKPLPIILDSNAFFVPLQFKINIYEELEHLQNVRIELVLLSPVKEELEKLVAGGSPKLRKDAAYALKLAEKSKLVKVNAAEGSADDVILKVAQEWNCPVFTNDMQLRKRLRDINVPVIYVRQKSRLAIDGRL
jgi:rRNA-processing protein FCF1